MCQAPFALTSTIQRFVLTVLLGMIVTTTGFGQVQTFKGIYAFTDGTYAYPFGSLILQNGSLYGVAHIGTGGYGIVFQLTETGTETTLYNFTGGMDGGVPLGPLVFDTIGNIYGTTFQGGAYGYGTVFKIDTAGNETALYSFHFGKDGASPNGGLAIDRKGNLYGTTSQGGEAGYGTVFQVTPTGVLTVLYTFSGGSDGGIPTGGLLRDGKGNLRGTTTVGGAYIWGTVFELIRSKKSYSEQVLYNFTGGADGGYPNGSLISDGKGNFYGTTAANTQLHTNGEVFELTPTGTVTVLHSFTGAPDGYNPSAGLVRDKHGNLYGTTSYGGKGNCTHQAQGCGTIFMVSSTGKEQVLYNFAGRKDGAFPFGGLVADATGSLYGTTLDGGDLSCGNGFFPGCGTVFQLVP